MCLHIRMQLQNIGDRGDLPIGEPHITLRAVSGRNNEYWTWEYCCECSAIGCVLLHGGRFCVSSYVHIWSTPRCTKYSRLQGMLQGEQGSISTRTNPSCRRAWALPCPAAANRSRQIGITYVSSVIKWRLDDDLDDGTVPVFACQKAAGCGFLELPYRRWRDRLFCTC